MNISAKLSHAKISAQKVRLVADQIRGKSAESAMELLNFSNKKSADILKKLLNSAIANAEHNNGLDIDELKVDTIYVNEAPTAKRFRARAKGRGDRILKRTCHVTIILAD